MTHHHMAGDLMWLCHELMMWLHHNGVLPMMHHMMHGM